MKILGVIFRVHRDFFAPQWHLNQVLRSWFNIQNLSSVPVSNVLNSPYKTSYSTTGVKLQKLRDCPLKPPKEISSSKT